MIILLFHFVEFAGQVFMGCGHFPEAHKRAHDGYVNLYRALAGKHAGEHSHALLCKGIGEEAT